MVVAWLGRALLAGGGRGGRGRGGRAAPARGGRARRRRGAARGRGGRARRGRRGRGGALRGGQAAPARGGRAPRRRRATRGRGAHARPAEVDRRLAVIFQAVAGHGIRQDADRLVQARLEAVKEDNRALARTAFSRALASLTGGEVVTVGVSGYTTAGGLARLDWSLADDPDMVIIVMGGNDMLRGLDPAATRANLDAMITRLRAQGVRAVTGGVVVDSSLFGADLSPPGYEQKQEFAAYRAPIGATSVNFNTMELRVLPGEVSAPRCEEVRGAGSESSDPCWTQQQGVVILRNANILLQSGDIKITWNVWK